MEEDEIVLSDREIDVVLDIIQNKKYLDYKDEQDIVIVEMRELLKDRGIIEYSVKQGDGPWEENFQLTLAGQAMSKSSSSEILENIKAFCNIHQTSSLPRSIIAGIVVIGLLYIISIWG